MADKMSAEEAAANAEAQKYLVRGKYYIFDPPVRATAIPTGGPEACDLEECEFNRGWYVGFIKGNHVFQGRPVNDRRVIPVPASYKGVPISQEIVEKLKESYFHVSFIGGSRAIPESD